jgi:hypothetical protein
MTNVAKKTISSTLELQSMRRLFYIILFESKFRVDHLDAYKHYVMLWRAKVQGSKAGEEVSLI